MCDSAIAMNELRTLLGRKVFHQGIVCSVVEVLEEGPQLVLMDQAGRKALQTDQFGDPHRQVPRTYIVPVLDETCDYHPDFLALQLLA